MASLDLIFEIEYKNRILENYIQSCVQNSLIPMSIMKESNKMENTCFNSNIFTFAVDRAVRKEVRNFKPEQIIFSNNVTTVIFEDGSKETVKTSQHDNFDPEMGVAMAIAQKIYKSRSQFVKAVDQAYEKSLERERRKENKKNKKNGNDFPF